MNFFLRTSFIFWILAQFLKVETLKAETIPAATLIVRHHKTTTVDFQIYREMNPHLRTLSMEWDRRPASEEKAFENLELLRAMQEALLQRQMTIAYKIQEELWNRRFEDDWTPPLRSLFLEVGLLRAVREIHTETQRQMMTEAFTFAQSFQEIQSLPLWRDPRLQTLLRLRWNARRLRTVSLSPLRQMGFQTLRLNGIAFSLESTVSLRLLDARARVTLLSNTWAPWSKTLETFHITKAEPELISLVQGDCANPQIHPLLKELPQTVHTVFDRLCTRIWTEGEWIPQALPAAKNFSFATPPPLQSDTAPGFFKRYGIPLVLAGIVTGVVMTFLKNRNSETAIENRNPQGNTTVSQEGSGQVISIPSRL